MNITTLEEFASSLPSLEEMDAYYDRFLQPAFSSYDYISYGKLFSLPEPHIEAKVFLSPIDAETKSYSIKKVEFYFNGSLFRELLKFENCVIWTEFFKDHWEFKIIGTVTESPPNRYHTRCILQKEPQSGTLLTWKWNEMPILAMYTRACMEIQRLYGAREIK